MSNGNFRVARQFGAGLRAASTGASAAYCRDAGTAIARDRKLDDMSPERVCTEA